MVVNRRRFHSTIIVLHLPPKKRLCWNIGHYGRIHILNLLHVLWRLVNIYTSPREHQRPMKIQVLQRKPNAEPVDYKSQALATEPPERHALTKENWKNWTSFWSHCIFKTHRIIINYTEIMNFFFYFNIYYQNTLLCLYMSVRPLWYLLVSW